MLGVAVAVAVVVGTAETHDGTESRRKSPTSTRERLVNWHIRVTADSHFLFLLLFWNGLTSVAISIMQRNEPKTRHGKALQEWGSSSQCSCDWKCFWCRSAALRYYCGHSLTNNSHGFISKWCKHFSLSSIGLGSDKNRETKVVCTSAMEHFCLQLLLLLVEKIYSLQNTSRGQNAVPGSK